MFFRSCAAVPRPGAKPVTVVNRYRYSIFSRITGWDRPGKYVLALVAVIAGGRTGCACKMSFLYKPPHRATKQTRRPPEGGDGWEALKYCANHARVVYKEKATASCPIYKSFIYLFIYLGLCYIYYMPNILLSNCQLIKELTYWQHRSDGNRMVRASCIE